ncbi:MAG TPA: PPK2 family polyphosphate kinase [Candidatus Acidoferrales bacterium]|nr:PPK2 family polyphosphate kinase [Candidatus Acidoferrales bacterium]
MPRRSIRDLLHVRPDGRAPALAVDPADTRGLKRKLAEAEHLEDQVRLSQLQERLLAEARRSLLVVFQGMDISGKDGAIRHLNGFLDPQGVRVLTFRPGPAEARGGFLDRVRRQLPAPGEAVICNRSYYEELVLGWVREGLPEPAFRRRCRQVNRFEAALAARGTTLVKLFLHISLQEQRRRLLVRLQDPAKRWRFDEASILEPPEWDVYQRAYAAILAHTSTAVAPWYTVPANKRWYRNWAVTEIVIETLEEMNPRYPQPKLNVSRLMRRLRAGPG